MLHSGMAGAQQPLLSCEPRHPDEPPAFVFLQDILFLPCIFQSQHHFESKDPHNIRLYGIGSLKP